MQLTNSQVEAAALKEKLAQRDALITQLKATPPPVPGQAELCALSLDVTEKDTRINELQNQVLTLQQALNEMNTHLKNHSPALNTP